VSRRKNTSAPGSRAPFSYMLTAERATPARTASSDWVSPAARLASRSTTPDLPFTTPGYRTCHACVTPTHLVVSATPAGGRRVDLGRHRTARSGVQVGYKSHSWFKRRLHFGHVKSGQLILPLRHPGPMLQVWHLGSAQR
jgi:hypothetical protein